jgi:pimeloyl-ACP methyl ester carboxylesterase
LPSRARGGKRTTWRTLRPQTCGLRTSIDPPYVLVRHSLGATHALLYASEHPNLVAGVVLLDPPPVGFMQGEDFRELHAPAQGMTAAYRCDAALARNNGNETEAVKLETWCIGQASMPPDYEEWVDEK